MKTNKERKLYPTTLIVLQAVAANRFKNLCQMARELGLNRRSLQNTVRLLEQREYVTSLYKVINKRSARVLEITSQGHAYLESLNLR